MTSSTDRRAFLRLSGGGALALLVADFEAVTTTCRLLPEQTEGPYYVPADLLRRDITEGIIAMQGHIGATTVLTSQLFFDDAVNDAVFALEPYSRHGAPDTRNDDDGIATGYANNGTLVTLKDDGAGKLGLVVVGVSA